MKNQLDLLFIPIFQLPDTLLQFFTIQIKAPLIGAGLYIYEMNKKLKKSHLHKPITKPRIYFKNNKNKKGNTLDKRNYFINR